MELRGQEERKGGRDYLALGVVIFLLVALVITAYLAFRAVPGGFDLGSGVSIREFIQGLEDKAKDWLEQKTKFAGGKRDTAREHLVEGYRLYRKKRYAKALEEFNKAVQRNETNPEAYYWRGRTLISQGRYEPAVEDFQKASKLKPDYTAVRGKFMQEGLTT
jgi:tetratricopeptide (TPR) repeat protein